MLFVIVMDVLNHLIVMADQLKCLTPIPIIHRAYFYAEYLVIFLLPRTKGRAMSDFYLAMSEDATLSMPARALTPPSAARRPSFPPHTAFSSSWMESLRPKVSMEGHGPWTLRQPRPPVP
jgi:hypothetical protein